MRSERVPVRFALPRFDHCAEIFSGQVELAGIDATFVGEGAPSAEADVIHVSLLDHLIATGEPTPEWRAIPVFPSRAFVHSWIHLSQDDSAADEIEEPSPTASIYARGILDELGERRPVLVAPPAQAQGRAGVRPLYATPGEVEREHHARTGVFPILGVVAIRSELLRSHRWLATNVYRAFEVARRRYFARLIDIRGSRVPLPSVAAHVRRLQQLLGPDICPYGLEQNRSTLTAFVRYAVAQGAVGVAPADVAELFVPVEPFVDYTDGV